MSWLQPVTLRTPRATLVPLQPDHLEGLIEAVRDGELWKLWYAHIADPDTMRATLDKRLALQAQGSMLPFTVIDNETGRIAGMTTYLNADAENRRVEIGATWYRKSVQRTSLNTHCKLALLSHAFDALECIAVEFRTHFFNYPSRRAIERLGAKQDGILRNHRRDPDGTFRDTVVFSIIASEWPTVRRHLTWQIERPRPDRSAS